MITSYCSHKRPRSCSTSFRRAAAVQMADKTSNRNQRRKGSERRTGPRYRLSAPPNIEILHRETVTPIQARLMDLSQGGCHIETDRILSLGDEVAVRLEKGGNEVRAMARVVRASPDHGLALAFTSMEGEGYRILDEWLSTFVATTWVATNRRRSQRAAFQIEVSVAGYNSRGAQFTEDTETVEISSHGGTLLLRTPVRKGQRVVLSNPKTKVAVECIVATIEIRGDRCLIGLAFYVPNQPFWPVNFPPVGWSQSDPYAKRYGS